MGDAQSAQREDKKDAAAEEEESGEVNDAQIEQNIEDKAVKNNEQISEINGKAEGSIAEVNGHCEDDIAAEAILSPDEEVPETEKSLKEEKTPFETVEINEDESPHEADPNEDVALEMTEMDAKQNDINEGFRRFFSNIGLKLTVKRGSNEIATDVPDKEEANTAADVEDTAKETKSENTEQNTDVNIAQEANDNDSTTCPTLTDVTSEDVLENTEERTTETKEEAESDNADVATTSTVAEDAQQDATPEEEPDAASPSSPEEEVVVSPIKRFFTTGIFSGLRKKKKPAEDETTEKELVDMGKNEVIETTEQTEQQQDKEEVSPCVDGAAVEAEHKENELKDEILSAASAQTTDEGKSSSRDLSTIVTEPENLSSQDKVQASPLKRLLSGSSLKKHSKKQRSRKSSDAKLSDSGEHVSEQLLSSTESAENQKEEGHAQPPAEAAGEEGAWASFKKLVTPKKRMKRSSLGNEETQIPVVAEPKPSETEQISDHSTEEGKKRKDSSVSWEAVLCGSGRRRSRKTSDSEDETPQTDINDHKRDDGSKDGAELPLESSNENENEILASSPKQAGSPPEGDGGSTWKSLKRLVTPKRKAKDEDESKDNVQSDSEVTQDESSFSIKKLLPGRKKRKSAEKQESSDEADKDVASDDEDSETPAVVPLSEFDTDETVVHIQTQADIESHVPKEANYELQQDLLDEMAERVLPCDNLQTEANEVQDNGDALEKQASTTTATNEEPDDLTESISKYQPLSDIPEEGIITETMATPASVAEEAAGDDTIAEDLIEITSEAITAPEPVADITLADETEMISAVSQLTSESSKTSGNTTPVPAEYDVMETDMLLHQVVEAISVSPEAVPVCSDELSSEKVVGSISQQILETFVKEEPTILKIQRSSDAIDINTNVEELDAIHELAAISQTESISEVESLVSTEVVSSVPSEKYDTAELSVDEAQEVNITHSEERFKELESIEESHHLVEDLSDINPAASTDKLSEGDEIVPDVGCLVEAHQAETQHPQIDSKDAAMEQEVQTVTEKEDQIKQNIADQIQVEDKDQPVEVEELQELAQEQAATLDSESTVESLEKEVISEDPPETITYDLKEETVSLTEANIEAQKEDELETDAAQTEHVQEPEASEAVQASTLDSKESSVQSPEEEVKPEDIPVSAEPEKLPVTTVKTEHVQAPEVLEAVQAEEKGSVQSLEKEAISEDVPEAESVDKLKEETAHLTEVNVEPVDAFKTGDVQEPEVLEAVQAEEEGHVQSLEKQVISEDVPEVETVADERKEETILSTEVNLEPVDASKTGYVQEQEVLQAVQAPILASEEGHVQSLEKEVISEDVHEAESVDKLKEETILPTKANLEPVDASKTDHVQELEVLDSEDHVQSLEKEVISEGVPELQTVTDEPKEVNLEPVEAAKAEPVQEPEVLPPDVTETKTEDEALLYVHVVTENTEGGSAQELEKQILEDQKSQSIPQDVRVEQEDCIPEVVDELQTLTAVHVSSVTEEAGHVQVLSSEEISAPCADNATVTDEPKYEVHLSAVQVTVEQEKESELPGTEIKTTGVEHALVAQVVNCNHKDVPVAIPDVLIEKTSATTEPLIDTVATELVFKEEVEAATPLVRDDVTETAEEGSVVRMMHVPSVKFEDNHRIQVQVVDVNIKSVETTVDSVLQVGLTEAKDTLDVCHETIKKVDNLSATPKTEDELDSEENNVTIQEVIQHVKEKLPETVPESVADILEQDVIKHSDAVTTLSEMVDHDQKENLDETKVEQEKSGRAEVIKSSSEELDVKKIHEQSQITQIAQSPIVTPSKTGLVVPENTGIISSTGNVESPSNLSLEFKLNIQFGQAKAPASPPPTMERIAPMKQTDVSEVGVQAVEAEEPVKPTQSTESQKQTEVTDRATETTKPVANLDSTERVMITTQPVLLNVGIQAMERVEPAQQIRSTHRLTSSIQATETTQPVRPKEKREVFLSKPVISEACDQETKAEEPAKQMEEENDQDVWMDAEEGIYTQEETEMSFLEVEEPLEPQTEGPQEENAAVEVETAPEEEESEQEIHKTGGACETESEEEDFAVALEHPDTAPASVTTAERD